MTDSRPAAAEAASGYFASHETSNAPHPLLACSNLEKRYGAVHALRGVDLDVPAGQFLALVGDNGAGKSTLAKIIAGAIQPTTGAISIDGAPTRIQSPTAARDHGIETVYQDLGLCDNLTVLENLFLGREMSHQLGPFRVLRRKEMIRVSAEALSRLSMNVPSPRAKVTDLSGGQRQAVALARARMWKQRLVLLDEPTAALGVEETRNCVKSIREVHASGAAIILISHDIPLVRQVAERVVVLRRGQIVGDVRTPDVSEHDIVALITGATRLGDVLQDEPSTTSPSDYPERNPS